MTMTNRRRIKKIDLGSASVGVNVLGIDYGRAHKGLAIGDMDIKTAMPLKTFDYLSNADFFAALRKIVSSYNVHLIVVGVPVTWPEDRSRPGMREEAEKFAKQINQELAARVELVDERFTSEAAAKLKRENIDGDEHALSAMLILQSYFDRPKRGGKPISNSQSLNNN